MENKNTLDKLAQNVYVNTSDDSLAKTGMPVQGYDLNKGLDYNEIFKTFRHTGFQATAIG